MNINIHVDINMNVYITHPPPEAGAVRRQGRWGEHGVGVGGCGHDSNIHVDINIHFDIQIIINVNLQNYNIYYLLSII